MAIRQTPLFAFSLASLFALIYPGTSNSVRESIQSYFGFSDSVDNMAHLIHTLNQCSSSTLISANSLWIDKDLTLLPSYKDTTNKLFSPSVFHLSFSDTEQAKKEINDWVKHKTKMK